MAAEAKRAVRPHPQQVVKCPRCNSSETKFCYYNNYSTTQPRYFCKNCKRYWTNGGTLRNVPVGGGLRKNKRSKTKLAATSSPPPTSSAHQHKPSSSAPTINVSGVNHSTIASHVGLPNPSPDNSHGLPHTPNYLVFNPRTYEPENQATPITGQMPLYQHEVNYNPHMMPPPSLSMLAGGLKQHEPTVSGAPYFTAYAHSKDHERALSESLQPGGYHHSHENSGVSYTMNNFVNVNDWQQISEGLFGGGGEGNYMFMQAPQPPQWADFDAGTRL